MCYWSMVDGGCLGDFAFARPYYQCRMCGGGLVPGDERPGVSAVGYTPALSRVAALTVTEGPLRATGERPVRNPRRDLRRGEHLPCG